mgnify:CR=1 FL=1
MGRRGRGALAERLDIHGDADFVRSAGANVAATITAQRIVGPPDLVVEVLSPATAGHDHIVKRTVYERARVREYWLVHPVDRIVTVYRLEGGRFASPEFRELTGRQAVTAVPGVEIDWDLFPWEMP